MTRLLFAVGVLSLFACTGTSTDSGDANCDGVVEVEQVSLRSDADGVLTVPVAVDANDDAFMVLVARDGGLVSADTVVDAEGDVRLSWEDWLSGRDSLTNAFYASSEVTSLNWPIRAEDAPLGAGEWTVYASTLDADGYPKARQDATVTVVRRSCVAGTPTLKVTVVYAQGLDEDREVATAVEAAVLRWAQIYGAYGLELDVSYASSDLATSVSEPLPGGDEYGPLYEDIGEGVVVVVADDVDGYADLYGEAGGIPGPYVASGHSAVAVSWLVHAGTDAAFTDDEVLVFGETMAHEVGHYLGLFHPVEMDWSLWDALSDTKRCTSESACEAALGDNLMFPYPVCGERSCTEQTVLSDDQSGVLGLNVGFR